MKFSELKIDRKSQFVEWSREGLPTLTDAIIEDFTDVHKEIIKITNSDTELTPEQEKLSTIALNNYYLFFFYGVYKTLQATSNINQKWKQDQFEYGEKKFNKISKVLK